MRQLAHVVVALALLAATPRPARSALCHFDANFDGTGVPVRWLASPIPYRINASRLPAAEQAAAIAAVKAAFSIWELSCTTLSFQYAGASTDFGEINGVINVYWGDDDASWTHGTGAYYWYFGGITSLTTGEMTRASIGMNIRDAQWTIGAEPGKFDIQTAVTRMIPGTIGFFVGPDPAAGNVGVPTGLVDHGLNQDHVDGARALYFKAGAGCTEPPLPLPCATWVAGPDAGPAPDAVSFPKDASPDDASSDSTAPLDAAADQALPPDQGTPPDIGLPADSGAIDQGAAADQGTGDGTTTAPGSDDGGCCSTAGTSRTDQGALFVLLGLALVALHLGRRRSGR